MSDNPIEKITTKYGVKLPSQTTHLPLPTAIAVAMMFTAIYYKTRVI